MFPKLHDGLRKFALHQKSQLKSGSVVEKSQHLSYNNNLLCILLFVFVLMSTIHATILVECGVLIRLFSVFIYDLAITLNKINFDLLKRINDDFYFILHNRSCYILFYLLD